ncbi:MAG: YbhB/YbcL family Raf kinase inhibitor-like protein [Ilumatobacteraceae bacterium]
MVRRRSRLTVARVASVLAAALATASCASDDGRTLRPPRADQGETVAVVTTPAPQEFSVTGPWSEGAAIDIRYTCDGENISPPLSWTPGPSGTVTYALVVDDLDAPEARHWVVANIDAATLSLGEGVLPDGAVTAQLADGSSGFAGPCPPDGETHDYVITVFAVSQVLEAQNGDDPATLRAAIEGATLAETSTQFTATG